MGKRRMSREAALEALGVARDAPPEDVRRAYHRKALASHPDKGGSVADAQAVTEARDRLHRALFPHEAIEPDMRLPPIPLLKAAPEPETINPPST